MIRIFNPFVFFYHNEFGCLVCANSELNHFEGLMISTIVRTPCTGDQPSQGRYLHGTTNRLNADIHASSRIRTHYPSVWVGEHISCRRPRFIVILSFFILNPWNVMHTYIHKYITLHCIYPELIRNGRRMWNKSFRAETCCVESESVRKKEQQFVALLTDCVVLVLDYYHIYS
jgi:hypothetical protein